MYNYYNHDGGNLAECLAEALGNTAAMYHKAQGHHWNVMGPDFHEYHSFFQMIYEDVAGAVDPLAENMRKIGALAPRGITELAALSSVEDTQCGVDGQKMLVDLFAANEVVIESINEAFACASAANEQGIADFLAGRDDMHKKWRWQINAMMSPSASQHMSCGQCGGMGTCNCPGAMGGKCTCSPACGCDACHGHAMKMQF